MATATAVYPSGVNTFVPSHEDSGRMVVDFSRNPNSFPINQYAQLVPVKRVAGYYQKMTLEEAARIYETDLSAHVWADGQDAPLGNEGAESFLFNQFTCKRYLYRANQGDLAIQNASWELVPQMARQKAQQAMTARTQLVVTQLTTAANFAAANQINVTSTYGGTWTQATDANLYIRKSIDAGITQIALGTFSTVKPEDLRLVVSPNLAKAMAESQEMINYIKGSPDAYAQLRGELPNRNKLYGLPAQMYGVEIIIEDTVKVTSKKGATRAASFVMPDATPALVSRPGGLIGIEGAPSFSTCTMFVYEPDDLTVQTLHDVDNRRVAVRVIDNIDVQITADVSGISFAGAY